MIHMLKSNNSSLELKIALGLLVITIVTGMGTIAYTASAVNTNSQNGQIMGFFDPFELTTIYFNIPENGSKTAIYGGMGIPPQANIAADSQDATASSGIIRRSPIRVPYRPRFRSPFRPPWTHPPTAPWYPGQPPWTPGPPPWNPNR